MEQSRDSRFARVLQRLKAKSSSFEAACSVCASILQIPKRMRARWRASRKLRRGCWLSLAAMLVLLVLAGFLLWHVDCRYLGCMVTGRWREQHIPVVGEEFVMKVGYTGIEELCQLSPEEAEADGRWMQTAWTEGPYVEVPGFDRPTEATLWYNATSTGGAYSCTGRYQVTVTAVILHNDPYGMSYSERHAEVDNFRLLERLTRPAPQPGAIAVLPGECRLQAIDGDRKHQVERYLVDIPAGRRLYVTAEPDASVDKDGRPGEPLLKWRLVRPQVKRAHEVKKGSPMPVTYLVSTEGGVHEIEVERNEYAKRAQWLEDSAVLCAAYGFRVTWGPSPWDNCPKIDGPCERFGLVAEAVDAEADGGTPAPQKHPTASPQSSAAATSTASTVTPPPVD